MKYIIGLLLWIPMLGWACCRIYHGVTFNQECGGYLENAAHAGTVMMALPAMDQAVSYLQSHRMTAGYTSLMWKTQDENVGYWYSNLVAARDDLDRIAQEKFSPLEESNVLMKLHQVLKVESGGGSTVRVPQGISMSPHNGAFFAWGLIGFLMAFLGSIVIEIDEP
jgi:hypothetical protein